LTILNKVEIIMRAILLFNNQCRSMWPTYGLNMENPFEFILAGQLL
jgi:hypothetical protein